MADRENFVVTHLQVKKQLDAEGQASVEALSVTGKQTNALPVGVPTYTVATVPAAASHAGSVIYVSNGSAGNPCLAFSDGTNWKAADSLANIAAA